MSSLWNNIKTTIGDASKTCGIVVELNTFDQPLSCSFNNLNYARVQVPSGSQTHQEIFGYLKDIKENYVKKVGHDLACFRYFIFHFNGLGGYDNEKGLFLSLDKKLYVMDIVRTLQQKRSETRRKNCVLILDVHKNPSEANVTHERLLPKVGADYNNIVIAFSGLQESTSTDNKSKWSKALFDHLYARNETVNERPLTDVLDDMKKEGFPGTDYESTTGQLFLYESRVGEKFKTISDKIPERNAYRGMIFVVSNEINDQDLIEIETTFKNLQFNVFTRESPDLTTLLAYIKLISLFWYSMSHLFFSFYYSGYGGATKDGRIYLELIDDDDDAVTHKVYLDWIVSLFRQRYYINIPCLLFLQLYVRQGTPTPTGPLIIPACDNFTIAISGFHEPAPKGGEWTHKLCEAINKDNGPCVTEVLDNLISQVEGAQYLNSAGLYYLQKPTRVQEKYEKVEMYFYSTRGTSETQPIKLLGTPPSNILDKQPRPADVEELLKDVASRWREIGENLMRDNEESEEELSNIDAHRMSDISKLVLVTNRTNNLTWSLILLAIVNVWGRAKRDEINTRLMTDPKIFSHYSD